MNIIISKDSLENISLELSNQWFGCFKQNLQNKLKVKFGENFYIYVKGNSISGIYSLIEDIDDDNAIKLKKNIADPDTSEDVDNVKINTNGTDFISSKITSKIKSTKDYIDRNYKISISTSSTDTNTYEIKVIEK